MLQVSLIQFYKYFPFLIFYCYFTRLKTHKINFETHKTSKIFLYCTHNSDMKDHPFSAYKNVGIKMLFSERWSETRVSDIQRIKKLQVIWNA